MTMTKRGRPPAKNKSKPIAGIENSVCEKQTIINNNDDDDDDKENLPRINNLLDIPIVNTTNPYKKIGIVGKLDEYDSDEEDSKEQCNDMENQLHQMLVENKEHMTMEEKAELFDKYLREHSAMEARKKQKIISNLAPVAITAPTRTEYLNRDVRPTEEVLVIRRDSSSLKDDAMSTYLSSCKHIGTMDSESERLNHYKRITRTYGWKHFKMNAENEYHPSSPFARYMMEMLHRDPDDQATIEWWGGIKGTVQRAMQDMRSTTTQAMKRVFIGTKTCYSF
jgi:hypothetical protein